MKEITKKAIALAGGPKALAETLGVTRQAVEQWERIPPKHVLKVEQLCGISRYDLRPDIYGDKPVPLASSMSSAVAA